MRDGKTLVLVVGILVVGIVAVVAIAFGARMTVEPRRLEVSRAGPP